ncbi:MAG: T9SS type A sorting domain-containing protein [Opitutaceae bacterium]|nr:T9SS type A sorting domain-containing protein [Cytophagales bacterium]
MHKILLSVLVILFGTQILSAQNNSEKFEWSFNTGGGYNNVKRMHYNSVGDLIIMETIADTGQFGNTILGAPKLGSYSGTVTFIGKRTQSGTYSVLVKHVSNQFSANFEDFTLDSEDNIIVSGNQFNATSAFDYGNGVTLMGKGFFITKYNAIGQAQWSKLYDLNTVYNATNAPISLGILPNNDIYFAAQSPNGAKPFWLIRLNSEGTELWHTELLLQFQNATPAIFSSKNNFFYDNEGTSYFYVPILYGSYLKVNGDSIVANPGTHPSSVFLLSIDNNGRKKEYKGYRGGIGDFCVERETGNIIIKFSQINANPAPFNTINSFNGQYLGLVALDKGRNYIKSTGTNFLGIADINALYPLGNFEVVGNSTLAPNTSVTAGTQTFTTTGGKYTPSWKFYGPDLNFKSFVAHPELNGSTSQAGIYMAASKSKLAIVGNYPLEGNSTVNVNGTTLISCFKNLNFGKKYPLYASLAGDLFISQLNLNGLVSSIQNESLGNINQASLYPNPAKSVLHLNLINLENQPSFQLVNTLGKIVLERKITSAYSDIDISDLHKGLYFGKITSNNELVKSWKLLIE